MSVVFPKRDAEAKAWLEANPDVQSVHVVWTDMCGVARGKVLRRDEVMQAWAREREVLHTSTHAGWPLGCATAIATLDALRFKQLVARSRDVGARFLDLLRGELSGAPGFVEARGAGLMIGVQLSSAAMGIATTQAMLREGYVVLTGGLAGETLTLTPALTIDEELLGPFARTLRRALGATTAA